MNYLYLPITVIILVLGVVCGTLMAEYYCEQKRNKFLKIKFMNSKAALCMSLLRGDVISIRTGFLNLGITNIPREIGRSIERPFGVMVSRTKKNGKARWGVDCYWFEYRLNKSEHNLEGIEKMKAYIKDHIEQNPKTDKEAKILKQSNLFV